MTNHRIEEFQLAQKLLNQKELRLQEWKLLSKAYADYLQKMNGYELEFYSENIAKFLDQKLHQFECGKCKFFKAKIPMDDRVIGICLLLEEQNADEGLDPINNTVQSLLVCKIDKFQEKK